MQEIYFFSSKVKKDTKNNGINHKWKKCGIEQGYCQNVLLKSSGAGVNSCEK
jgi:hypothetical protein